MTASPLVFRNVERLFAADGSSIHAALSGGTAPRSSQADVDAKVAVIGAVLAAIAEAHGPPALVGLAEVETPELVQQVAEASARAAHRTYLVQRGSQRTTPSALPRDWRTSTGR